ncbi:MAG: hypothetical protein M9931_05230 [Chitinophagales bacterium]|nr:hypothetical protein [Chitinophagales bacterium]MCO5280444.1 hypothetical protein [Chitinophagales bacterium]OJV25555.1 MAG: hypothetical protein BGO32_00650 [Bacteroidetes bacterium 37-13]
MLGKYWISLLLCVFVLQLAAQEDNVLPPTPKFKKMPRSEEPSAAPENAPNDDVPGTINHEKKDEEFKPFSKRKKFDLSKFIIEPNFNLSLGSGRFDVGLSPYVGYRIWQSKKAKSGSMTGLYAGGGITYYYTGFNNLEFVDPSGTFRFTTKAKFQTYGGGVFLQYNIWKGFFARARFEVLHRDLDDIDNAYLAAYGPPQNTQYKIVFPRIQKTIPSLLIGVGYNLLQSRNFFFPLMVSYNVLHTVVDQTYSLYPRGIVVQLGFINLF